MKLTVERGEEAGAWLVWDGEKEVFYGMLADCAAFVVLKEKGLLYD